LFSILLVFHVLICIALVITVLMQSAKGEGLAGAFGGGGGLSGAVFGGRGAASFLSRSTTVLAVFFMVSCLGLSLMSAGRGIAVSSTDGSSVTDAAQQDMAAQQQAAQQQEAQQQQPQEGESVLPEDIFDIKPAGEDQQTTPPSDSQ
jgi:preprotein translocase subunit SecG